MFGLETNEKNIIIEERSVRTKTMANTDKKRNAIYKRYTISNTNTVAVVSLSIRNRIQAIPACHSTVPIGIQNLIELSGQTFSKRDLHACKQQRKVILYHGITGISKNRQ